MIADARFAAALAFFAMAAAPVAAFAQSAPPVVVSPRMILRSAPGESAPKPLVRGVVLQSPIGWIEAMRIPAGPIALAGGSRIDLQRDLLMPRALLDVPVADIPSGARLYCLALFGRYNVQFNDVAAAVAPGRSANKLPAFMLCAVADASGDTFSRLVVLDRKAVALGHADLAAPMPLNAQSGVAMPEGALATLTYGGGAFAMEIQNSIYQDGAKMPFDALQGWAHGKKITQTRVTYVTLPGPGQSTEVSVLGARLVVRRTGTGKDDLTLTVEKGFDGTVICNNGCDSYYGRWRGVLPAGD